MREIDERDLTRYIQGIESLLKCTCGLHAFFCERHRNGGSLLLSQTETGSVEAVLERLVATKRLTRLNRRRIEERLGGKVSEHTLKKAVVKITLAGAAFVTLYTTGRWLYGFWLSRKKDSASP